MADRARYLCVRRGAHEDRGGHVAPKPAAISLFSGALGLDLGLERAGIELRVAVESNRFAAATIRANRPKLPLLEKRIQDISTRELLRTARLRVGEATVVTGGPSCQSFSTA